VFTGGGLLTWVRAPFCNGQWSSVADLIGPSQRPSTPVTRLPHHGPQSGRGLSNERAVWSPANDAAHIRDADGGPSRPDEAPIPVAPATTTPTPW